MSKPLDSWDGNSYSCTHGFLCGGGRIFHNCPAGKKIIDCEVPKLPWQLLNVSAIQFSVWLLLGGFWNSQCRTGNPLDLGIVVVQDVCLVCDQPGDSSPAPASALSQWGCDRQGLVAQLLWGHFKEGPSKQEGKGKRTW